MGLVIVGLSHRTAPVGLRERLSIPSESVGPTLEKLAQAGAAREAVLLSTCNRMEIYARPESDPARAVRALSTFFETLYRDPAVQPALYRYEGTEAVRHLFRVSAGLDSMVVGESEILGQVKSAYQLAQQHGKTGKITNVLFQRALFVGKQVRTKTEISEGSSSVGSVAVQLAERIFGSLHDRRVLLLGAGEMAEVTARHLMSQKTARLKILNRTFERAQALAATLNGTAAPIETLFDALLEADIVICSASSERPLVTRDAVQAIMKARRDRSTYFIDIAVPRNVDPEAHEIDNVYLYNIDDLQRIVEENMGRRRAEMEQAERFVDGLAREFYGWIEAAVEGRPAALRHGDQHLPLGEKAER
ncbi:MAG: glutamyl-tRNA reductase [Elusimicrobia bacterium]|nr:glutamyl-tRNA reductase [Elusimicrobiota bacterium]